jgi:Na+/glutamate symporter
VDHMDHVLVLHLHVNARPIPFTQMVVVTSHLLMSSSQGLDVGAIVGSSVGAAIVGVIVGECVGTPVARQLIRLNKFVTKPSLQAQVKVLPILLTQSVLVRSQPLELSSQGWEVGMLVGASVGAQLVVKIKRIYDGG